MRKQVGTVEILEPRLYPRYPIRPAREITTADELVNVDSGLWPVYRDDNGVIYWEMSGDLVKIEPVFESLGEGMFMSRNRLKYQGETVIFKSVTYTPEEFAEFRSTSELVVGDDSVKRLVFEVEL